ncbi:LLM class flavin-dependent oxidoreductase [Methylococcaceae bacterium WWC4]|nr:LLM class flavin-dependent oxidoreductase [Methylococcaceae bacterium WWC4]
MNTEPLSTSADQQAMRFGLFANFENPGGGFCAEALRESVLTVQHAERLGFAEAWITEHHFNPFSVSAAIFPLLSYLAAATTTIRLGSAAVLLPMRDILQVAEDAATVDALSGGRLLLGVARGGPFPLQFQHFGVDQATSRERLLEGALLLEKLLTEENVDFDGRYYRYQQVSIYPRPRQSRIPIWLAALSPESIALAATRGYGLMGASAAPVEKLHTALASYRARAARTAPPFVLSRYFFCAEHRRAAIDAALPFVRDFARNMGAAIQRAAQSGSAELPFGVEAEAFAEERILANAIVGDVAECLDKIRALHHALGPHTLILKPASYDPLANRAALSLIAGHLDLTTA